MKSNFALILLFVSLLYSSKTEAQPSVNQVRIIPDPSVVVPQEGTFEINSETTYYAPSEVENAANFLEDYLKKGADITLKKADLSQADVVFTKVNSISAEGYTLTITDQKLKVAYADATGAFYAVQTLRQLLPAALERSATGPERSVKLPQLSITDAPKFEYRGMHLDVARHFFPKEFIKDYISYLAMLKMNTFHWHLTDDQGWRIEI
ncbi:MAG: glycoside hydrolase family 20 zincin-like fold domain-containing protein, partial [Marinirhabdus sp.]|nr:glycoside hydrolase family 20 zincin-like fold domain-containing protein [Marinirhabdus sp.]